MATSLSQIELYPNSIQEEVLLHHSNLLKTVRYELEKADIAHKNVFRKHYTLQELFMLLKQMHLYNPAYSSLYSKSLHYVAREVGGHKVAFLPATADITTYPISVPVTGITLTYGYFTTKKYGSIVTNGILRTRVNMTDAFIYRTNRGWMLSLLTA